jgi:PKD repeat protein
MTRIADDHCERRLVVFVLLQVTLLMVGPAIAEAPVADFRVNPPSGTAPLFVQFNDTSANTPTGWAWDFDNDLVIDSTGQNATCTYATAGTYTVNLTVTNEAGSDSDVKADIISVRDGGVLPGYNNIFIGVANDDGVKYDAFGNDTYNIRFEGIDRGLNALHISTDPTVNFGQVTRTESLSGSFYATDSGGKGYEDEILLMVAANGTIPDDFTLRIAADGYTWEPNPESNRPPNPDNVTYVPVALDETFTKGDFVYGPQTWKPTGNEAEYPVYAGQDLAETGNTFRMMFVDLNAGVLRPNTSLVHNGAVRITYTIENSGPYTAFSVYGYCQQSNNGDDMVAWTNALVAPKALSGYSVYRATVPAADFGANATTGAAPLSVKFEDHSTNLPTAWAWDFENDGVTDSTDPSPVFTYGSAGTYSVNLTVANGAGSDSEVRDRLIVVTGSCTPGKIGVFRPSTHMYYQDYNGNGVWNGASVDRAYNFGMTGDLPVTGDWNHDGTSEIGVFRPSTHMYYQDYNGNGVWNGASVDRAYNFGITGDVPVAGDWNHDGTSEIGVFRPSTHMYYQDYNGNGVWNGASVDRAYNFGITGDLPVAGDWNHDGTSEIGVFRPSTHMYYQDYNGNGVWNGAIMDRAAVFGITGDVPVAGNW